MTLKKYRDPRRRTSVEVSEAVRRKTKAMATGLVRERAWEPGYLYHVTFARHLRSVADRGLRPEKDGISHGVPFLAEHSQGKVFVSTWLGIRFWADSAADIAMELARAAKKDPCAEGWVPVLLRVPADLCVAPDIPGWKDSRAEAFATGPVEPDVIELFAGRRSNEWLPIKDYAAVDVSGGCVVEVDESARAKHFPPPKALLRRLSTVIVLEGKESPLMPARLPDPQEQFYR